MRNVSGMMMIGSTGRDSGKTLFACSLIRKLAGEREVVGVKVTTIDHRGGACPRGGEGCGVCASLEDDYCITEESSYTLDKDTSRLLAAGAKKVYWLRVLKECLAAGLAALLERIGPGVLTVCESNSLRTVAEPDLFLMFQGKSLKVFKQSAESVRHCADRFVHFDGKGFDLDPDEISVVGGSWALRRDATAVVLAGGASSRMGTDKSRLAVGGKWMIEHICDQLSPHFREVLISANNAEEYSSLNLRVVPDEAADQGPLMAIASCLQAAAHESIFFIACDIPHVDAGLLGRLMRAARDCDGAVPVTADGRHEPLFAVYNRNTLPAAREALAAGNRRADEILRRCNVKCVELATDETLTNINTPADYEQYLRMCDDTV